MKILIRNMAFLVVGVLFLSACGAPDPVHDPALFGTWHWDGNINFTYIFESDGTGRRGDRQVDEFTWDTRDDDLLVLNFGSGFADDEWTWQVVGDRLTIVNRNEPQTFSYLRPNMNPALVGTWVWDMSDEIDHYEYVFADNGTLVRGFIDEPLDNLNWFTADNLLVMYSGVNYEMWYFTISGNVLTIDNFHVSGQTFNYIRAN